MRNSEFFQGIAHGKASWGKRQISVPLFYYDMTTLAAFVLAPTEKVKSMLPSTGMNPYRVTPWHSTIAISAYEYRDTDIKPYNEVAIGVPFVMHRVSPLFTGVLRKTPAVPMMYIHHLPVTTEIARAAGVEFAGFPKFLADVSFKCKSEWLSCSVSEGGKHILTLTGRKLKLRQLPRQRLYPITFQKDRLLRLELILSECEGGISKVQTDIKLELGDHQIAQELRNLKLGRILQYEYCPQRQAILTPVCESYHS